MDRLGDDGALPGASAHIELQHLTRTGTLRRSIGVRGAASPPSSAAGVTLGVPDRPEVESSEMVSVMMRAAVQRRRR